MRSTALLLTVFVAICTAGAQAAPRWEDAVVYEVFVRSFNDSDGDGIGDFRGVEAKLEYIQELGADAVWLMPSFASTSGAGSSPSGAPTRAGASSS